MSLFIKRCEGLRGRIGVYIYADRRGGEKSRKEEIE